MNAHQQQASLARRVFVEILGDPVPKGRPRTVTTKTGKSRTFTPTRTAEYEEQIGYVWVADLGRPEPFVGPVAVTIHVRERVYPSDLDNYVKVALDALNELAWADDKQVVSITATIERHSASPGLTVEITGTEE